MNKVYTNNRNKKVGKDKGSHIVYHIYAKGKHRGIHQGYIGYSCLTLDGVRERYIEEIKEAFSINHQRSIREVHKRITEFKNDVCFKVLASGLTKDEAKQLEKALRPNKEGVFGNRFNWNVKSGG